LPQGGRQTGSVLADASSDRALSDNYLLHGMHSSYESLSAGERPPEE
jgi:hypothetical protein